MLLGNNAYFTIYSTMLTIGVQNIKNGSNTRSFHIQPTVHYPCSDITSSMLCDVKTLVINIFLRSLKNDCFVCCCFDIISSSILWDFKVNLWTFSILPDMEHLYFKSLPKLELICQHASNFKHMVCDADGVFKYVTCVNRLQWTNFKVNRNHLYFDLQRHLSLCKALSQFNQNNQALCRFSWDIKFKKQNETTTEKVLNWHF